VICTPYTNPDGTSTYASVTFLKRSAAVNFSSSPDAAGTPTRGTPTREDTPTREGLHPPYKGATGTSQGERPLDQRYGFTATAEIDFTGSSPCEVLVAPCVGSSKRLRPTAATKKHVPVQVLEARWRDGTGPGPVDVDLGPMPPDATEAMRGIANDLRTRIGLRLADGDADDVPYAYSEAINAGHAANPDQAARAIRRLVKSGVVRFAGELRPKPRIAYGTRLYGLPVAVSQATEIAVEAEHGAGVIPEPAAELPEESGMADAVGTSPAGTLDGLVAVASGADVSGGVAHGEFSSSIGHAAERITSLGGVPSMYDPFGEFS
jgi:hypothetical protein